MKLHNLKVRGAIGFKKGLGLDEVNVDFSGLSGLVAITGPNGHGKSTLIESLSPYRMFASRDGALRHHFFLRDSFKDLTFEYNGDIYRTLVKVDSDTDRSEGFIWKNDEPQIDGKVTNYDRYITKLLGSENLFYNSVFCAQNSGKLSDMTTGQLKSLFVEFLRLDRLSGYEANAKQCVGVLSGISSQAEKSLEAMRENYRAFRDLDCQINQAETEAEMYKSQIAICDSEINEINDRIKNLEGVLSKNAVNIDRANDLKKDIQSIRDAQSKRFHSHREEQGQLETDISLKEIQLLECQEDLKIKDAVMSASEKKKEIEREIAEIRKEYDGICKSIEDLYADDRVKGGAIDELRSQISEIESNDVLFSLEEKADAISLEMTNIEREIEKLNRLKEETEVSFEVMGINSEIKTCMESMSLLDKRDSSCKSETCSFIVSAIEAKKKIPELKEKKQLIVEGITKKVAELESQISGLKTDHEQRYVKLNVIVKEIQELKAENEEQISGLKSKIEIHEIEQKNIRRHIEKDLNPSRGVAGDTLFSLENQLIETKDLAEKVKDIERSEWMEAVLTSDINGLKKQLDDKKQEYSKLDLSYRLDLKKLENRLVEVNCLIDEDAEKKILNTRIELGLKESEKEKLSGLRKKVEERIVWLKGKLEEKADLEWKIKDAEKVISNVKKESSQWVYLQNACGKNGLQALEIDGVAPLVAGYGNDLLTSSFGPNFSVKIITQDPETGKETFDIMVIRSDGSETSFKKLSGGEKVWILKSIRLGMTLVSKEKSGRNFKTLLADEEDGPLDSEKAQSFIGLYRSILEVGGFDTCLYISHNPDVVGMADHLINFNGNGIEVM